MFVKNHKKINKQKKIFQNKNLGCQMDIKGNELRLWDGKTIICKYLLLKNRFKTIIIPSLLILTQILLTKIQFWLIL